jgi:uncharacterized protein YbjT (DUF2867 family)
LSNAEQTAAIAEATGRLVRYIDIPENAARDSMLATGMPTEIVEGLLEFTAEMRTGSDQAVSSAITDIAGHPPGPARPGPPRTRPPSASTRQGPAP